jgi:hypothetical protein
MKVTITSIELKSPWHFFALSLRALRIIKQLKATKGILDKKTYGFWTKHYTMTLWYDESHLKTFSKSGAHLEAMKISKDLAKEIRTLTYDAKALPKWSDAKKDLLTKGRVLNY